MTDKLDRIIEELELWSVADLVPEDLQGLCNEAANELRKTKE